MNDSAWLKLPPITVVMQSWRFTVMMLKDISATIWIWVSLYVLLKNIVLVALIMVSGLFLIGVLVSSLRVYCYRYRFADNAVEINSGVFSRSSVRIPFNRVLTVELEQPWLYRWGNYVSATFDSAGQSKKDGFIPGLKRSVADAIKEHVLSNKDRLTTEDIPSDKGLSATSASDNGNLVLVRNNKDLFIFGLCHNRIFIFLGLFIGLYYKAKDVIKNLDQTISDWLNTVLPVNDVLLLVIIGTAGVLLLIALSAIGSGVMQVVQSYGYRLFWNDTGLTQSEGLFTKKHGSIHTRKLQRVAIRETLMDRLAERCGIHLVQMNGSMVVPGKKRDEVDAVVQSVYPAVSMKGLVFTRLSLLRVLNTVVLVGLPLMYLSYEAYEVSRPGFGLAFLILACVFVLGSALRWYRYGVCDTEHYLFVRQGRLNQLTYCVDKTKLQAVSLSQSGVEKTIGVATVKVHLTGKTLTLPGMDEDGAFALANDVAKRVIESRVDWI